MKELAARNVRNIALVGHTGSGKTSLLDAMLYKLGVNDRLGSPAESSSMADWSDEEKDRKITIWAKPFNAVYASAQGGKYDLVVTDTPGYADFYGQMVAATAVADAGLVVVDAASGIQVGTNRAWRHCEALGLPRGIAITGLDKENTSFDDTLNALRSVWGDRCRPASVPTPDGKGVVDVLGGAGGDIEALKNALVEAAAETDDQLIEKYLGGETLTPEEIATGLRKAVATGKLIPVFVVLPKLGAGIVELMEGLVRFFPSPLDREVKDAESHPVEPGAESPFVGQVWKAVNDPFVGQLTILRVFGGTLRSDSEIYNATKEQKERIGTLYLLNGKKQESVTEAGAGEIVALAKLKVTMINDTLCAPGKSITLKPIQFPNPTAAYAVAPKTQGDEDKLSTGLHRVADEDPTLKVDRNAETKELILYGMGDLHLDITLQRMKKRSNVEIVLSTPKVPYKETVTALGEGHYKHKKQTGGRGQYGEVYLRVQPKKPGETEWFEDALVGTNVPRNFLPAIQKGCLEGMNRGAVAGYPVINTKVSIYDGSSHDVDSSEIAFKIAAARAFSDGMGKARAVLLEPIMTVRIMVPDQYMGDITGDMNHKRGRILGIGTEDGMQVITAEVPQAEMFRYSSELRSITGGRGSFEMEVARYDIVPSNVAQKIIAEAQKNRKAEEE
ncbi:MAG: elongation factor G [Verrucomicrobia bacterium]|nr:elongation factor G [Verrucomicrobiota bacterium]